MNWLCAPNVLQMTPGVGGALEPLAQCSHTRCPILIHRTLQMRSSDNIKCVFVHDTLGYHWFWHPRRTLHVSRRRFQVLAYIICSFNLNCSSNMLSFKKTSGSTKLVLFKGFWISSGGLSCTSLSRTKCWHTVEHRRQPAVLVVLAIVNDLISSGTGNLISSRVY